MPFDAWHLRRFRVDPRESRRIEVDRLEELGVVMTEIAPSSAAKLLVRFVEEFVDPRDAGALLDHLEASHAEGRALEIARWIRPDRARRGGPLGCARWLAAGRDRARCVRFERRVRMPALEIDLATLDDAWAASWPGVFVNFDAGRAVVITLDYEDVRCDVREGRSTPYR